MRPAGSEVPDKELPYTPDDLEPLTSAGGIPMNNMTPDLWIVFWIALSCGSLATLIGFLSKNRLQMFFGLTTLGFLGATILERL